MLEGGPLLDNGITDFAKQAVLFCHITSQIQGEPHPQLLREKRGVGFPHLVVLDAAGNVLVVHEDENSIAGFRRSVMEATKVHEQLQALRKQEDGGDAAAARQLFSRQVELAHIEPAEAWPRLAQLGFTAAEQARLTGQIARTEVGRLLGDVSNDVQSQIAAGERTAAMAAKGRIPAESRELFYFWGLTFRFAESKGDVGLLETCRNGAKQMQRPDPNLLKNIDAALAKLGKGNGGG